MAWHGYAENVNSHEKIANRPEIGLLSAIAFAVVSI